MKTKLLIVTFALTIMPKLSISQLVLNNSEMLPFGSVMTLSKALNYSLVDTVTQGQNVIWNMTSLSVDPAGTDLVVSIVNPTGTPYGSSFPTSNYGYSENGGSAYRYFDLSSSKMERVGSYSGGTLKTYNDPQEEYVFPMTYGTSNLDAWDNDVSSSGGTYDLTCVGTGTLNLPGGSYQALMVRVHVIEGFLDFYAYYWYDANNGAILVQLIIGDGFWIVSNGRFSTNLVVGTEELESLTDFQFNNPVTNQLNVKFNNNFGSDISFNITDLNGRIISNGIPETNVDKLTIQQDFSNLENGVYLLNILNSENGEILRSERIVKL